MRTMTGAGIGTVRMRLPLPAMSGMTQRPSRLLDVFYLNPQELGPAQAAAEQQSEDGAIALAFEGRGIGSVQ